MIETDDSVSRNEIFRVLMSYPEVLNKHYGE